MFLFQDRKSPPSKPTDIHICVYLHTQTVSEGRVATAALVINKARGQVSCVGSRHPDRWPYWDERNCRCEWVWVFFFKYNFFIRVSVRFSSVTQSCPTFVTLWDCSTPGLPVHLGVNSQSLIKLMSIESVMPSNHLTFCHLLLLLP